MNSQANLRYLAAAAIALLLAAVVISQLGKESAAPPVVRNLSAPTEGWAKLERLAQGERPPNGSVRALQHAYTIMRTPPGPMPAPIAEQTATTLGAPPQALDFRGAQYADSLVGGIWMVSGQNIACIAQAGPGAATCGTVGEVVQDGLVISIGKEKPGATSRGASSPQQFEILGVAPNGTSSVQVQVGRTTRRIPIRGNTYSFRADKIVLVKRLVQH